MPFHGEFSFLCCNVQVRGYQQCGCVAWAVGGVSFIGLSPLPVPSGLKSPGCAETLSFIAKRTSFLSSFDLWGACIVHRGSPFFSSVHIFCPERRDSGRHAGVPCRGTPGGVGLASALKAVDANNPSAKACLLIAVSPFGPIEFLTATRIVVTNEGRQCPCQPQARWKKSCRMRVFLPQKILGRAG
jgi:hypothetical protein